MSRIFIGGTVSSWRETVINEFTVPYFDPTTPGTFEEL